MDYSSTEFINPSLRIIVLGIYCLLALYSKMRKMDGNCLGERSGQPVKYFFFFNFGNENYVFLVTSYQECFQ